MPAISSASETSGATQPMQGGIRTKHSVASRSTGAIQADMAWQGAVGQGRAHSASLTPRHSGHISQQRTCEDGEEDDMDSDDMHTEKRSQQAKDRPRKPHLQGRFSGRLETKVHALPCWLLQSRASLL